MLLLLMYKTSTAAQGEFCAVQEGRVRSTELAVELDSALRWVTIDKMELWGQSASAGSLTN